MPYNTFARKQHYMIILHCVREHGKLRVKFHTYINHENKLFTNVYDNRYNCMFPKDIRRDGVFYKVNDADIRLAARSNSVPYYSVKRKNIAVMTEEEKQHFLNPPRVDISTIKIYDAGDCVICLSTASAVVFVPCGHRCVCSLCNSTLQKTKYCCPVCRESISENITT
jgi:hypothetical protein